MLHDILFALLGYLAGSIPFGLLLTRAAGLGDIRSIGSGNIGATNVLRTGNKKLALATLLLDGAKGAVAVLIAWSLAAAIVDCHTICASCLSHPGLDAPPSDCVRLHLVPLDVLITGMFAVLGHVFPVWLGFRGGKGVATTLGVLLAWSWPVGAIACLAWLLMAAVFRYSSLAALTALLVAPVAAVFVARDGHLALAAALVAVLVWYRHRANIRRLLAGEEPKIGRKKTQEAAT